MVVFYSIRQLLRTPVKTIFFFVLLAGTIAFFALGYNLWTMTAQNIDQINRSFTTIGTVEQKPMSLQTGAMWNAYTKRYTYSNYPTYGSQIPLSALDFKGANYILGPEKRPYYVAYDPSYIISDTPNLDEASFDIHTLIVEIEPVADCIPSEPVPVRVKNVLLGRLGYYMDEIWFCDTLNDKPEPMYAGKTYIMCLQDDYFYFKSSGNDKSVYMPGGTVDTTQSKKNGERIPSTVKSAAAWDEVTDNFFDTPRGKQWQAFIDSFPKLKHSIPVVPTNGTKLLMEFYTGDTRIIEGRDISAGEYQNGEKVCLVQDFFAKNNGLKVGDSIPLPLLYANYRYPSTLDFGPKGEPGLSYSLVNAKGEAYPVFENSIYRIVGIYNTQPTGLSQNYQLGGNAVVIPFASLKNSDDDNIVTAGPMMGYSTSFQIPNGQIEQYMAAWQAQNIAGLDIKFYDKGYTQIKAGLDSMMNVAIILFTVGAATTLFVLILFCHLFVTKQRKRTAIERSLGMSKKQCAASLLVGMLIIVVAACAAAGVASYHLTSSTMQQVNAASSQNSFDTLYSDWAANADAANTSSITVSTEGAGWGALAGAVFIPVALLIAWGNIRGNLKQEPLRMLSEKER